MQHHINNLPAQLNKPRRPECWTP